MKAKCGYCGSVVSFSSGYCERCGAPEDNWQTRGTVHDPRTWYEDSGFYPYGMLARGTAGIPVQRVVETQGTALPSQVEVAEDLFNKYGRGGLEKFRNL